MAGATRTAPGGEAPRDPFTAVAADAGASRQSRPPIVDDVEPLRGLLDAMALADRAVAHAIELLIDLRRSGAVETTTGLNVELWLAQVARRTHADVRMLGLAADLLPRLPGIWQSFDVGRLSWAQLRALLLEVRRLPVSSLDEIDAHVCAWLDHAPDAAPDEITAGVARLAWQLDERREHRRLADAERAAERSEFVALQPRLDGTGGRIWGELAAPGFATVDAALNHQLRIPAGRGDFNDPGDRDGQVAAAGKQRAGRLIAWADHQLAGCDGNASNHGSAGDDGNAGSDVDDADDADSAGKRARGTNRSRGSRPTVLLRTSLDTLLGGRLPAELLTHLSGGKLTVTSTTARRMIDERGADLRMIVLDDTGSVVGVGRRTYVPPGIVTDAGLAMTATCEVPGCTAAARISHSDHARPFRPTSPDQLPGTTDVGNNGPLCPRHNIYKERAGWRSTRLPNGVRRWHHPRSGITATHYPDHWQPPPARDGEPPPATDVTDDDGPGDHGPGADPTVEDWLDPPDPDLPF